MNFGPSVYLVHLISPAAQEWWDENVGDGPMWGGGYAVEHRYIAEIVEGMKAAGLTKSDFVVDW